MVLVARNLPLAVIQFLIFEHARVRVWESRAAGRDDKTSSLLQTGLVTGRSAGNAGAVAAFVTTPSDVDKMRMILDARTHEESETGAKLTRKVGEEAGEGAGVHNSTRSLR